MRAITISKRDKKIARIILSAALYYTGILNLIEKFDRSRTLTILAYHKVTDDAPYLGIAVRRENFRRQMEFIKKRYRVISLREAVDRLERHETFARKTIVVTFDDGDASILNHAMPLLKELGIPATLFLTVGPVETQEVPWFELLMNAIENTSLTALDLRQYGIGEFSLASQDQKDLAVKRIAAYIKTLDRIKRKEFLDHLSALLPVEEESRTLPGEGVLSWGQVKEMKKNGISLGAHTVNHFILTRLTPQEAEYEISSSKKMIEERTGAPVDLFAYPNGSKGDFDDTTKRLLKKHGFRCACTLSGGRRGDLFELGRVCINENVSTGLHGSFSKAQFAATVSGIFS